MTKGIKGFQKGIAPNPNGRPKGTPNKTTSEIKNLMQAFISENMETLQKDFDELEAKDRLMFFEKALKFILPTQQAQELRITDIEIQRKTLSDLFPTDEEISQS